MESSIERVYIVGQLKKRERKEITKAYVNIESKGMKFVTSVVKPAKYGILQEIFYRLLKEE